MGETGKSQWSSLSRSEQMLTAFNVYRTTSLLEVLDQPKTYAFVDGVVVESIARVISADPVGLVLAVDRTQLAALERKRILLLESPLHGATFHATVDAIDHRRAYVSLSSLQPFETYQERRAQCRTVPSIPLLARLHGRGHAASGRVLDLSIHSLAADFDARAFARVSQAAVVRLDVWGEPDAPSPFPDFETTAQISRSTAHEENGVPACRAVLEFDSYPALSSALHRYVARRQRDILMELRVAGNTAE